ncbi:putative photosystem I [Helianthus debilis subsp. tardiflorus]
MFSNTAIQLQPVFAHWIQNTHALAPGATAPGATASTTCGGDIFLCLYAGELSGGLSKSMNLAKNSLQGCTYLFHNGYGKRTCV